MTNNKTGLERFVEFLDTHLVFNSGDDRMITMNRAKQLLSEEKAVPIHADWKLREELGEYMDELKESGTRIIFEDVVDDLQKILVKCPAVYFMEDRPTKPEAKQDDTAVLVDDKTIGLGHRFSTLKEELEAEGQYRNDGREWLDRENVMKIISRHQGETK